MWNPPSFRAGNSVQVTLRPLLRNVPATLFLVTHLTALHDERDPSVPGLVVERVEPSCPEDVVKTPYVTHKQRHDFVLGLLGILENMCDDITKTRVGYIKTRVIT